MRLATYGLRLLAHDNSVETRGHKGRAHPCLRRVPRVRQHLPLAITVEQVHTGFTLNNCQSARRRDYSVWPTMNCASSSAHGFVNHCCCDYFRAIELGWNWRHWNAV